MVVGERLVLGGQHHFGHLLAPLDVVGTIAQHLIKLINQFIIINSLLGLNTSGSTMGTMPLAWQIDA